MKKIGSYFLTCLVIALLLAPVMHADLFKSFEDFGITILFGLIYTFSGLYGSIWLFRYLDHKYDWIKDIWKRLVIGVIAVELWGILIYVLLTPLLLILFKGEALPDILHAMKKNIAYPLVMGVFGMVIIAAVEFFKNWKLAYVKQEKLKAEMMAYQYEALHNQLNPHFLFNSFNVLSSLVYESQDLAVTFIDQLSDLYRRVLNGKAKELVPLSEELEFIQSYIFLLKTRFQDKLEIEVDVNPLPDEWIAPMVLQLLIENAVKHNSISKERPLVIRVQKTGNTIETRNALRIKKAGDDSRGMGLRNIRQRYSFLTESPIEIIQTAHEFIVWIPLLKRNGSALI
jgi:hypothetical protein